MAQDEQAQYNNQAFYGSINGLQYGQQFPFSPYRESRRTIRESRIYNDYDDDD